MAGWEERMRWSDEMFRAVVWPEARRVLPEGDLVSVQAEGPWSRAAHALDLAGVDFLTVCGRCVTATIASRVQRWKNDPPSTLTLGVAELAARIEAIRSNGLVPDYTVHAYLNAQDICSQVIAVPTAQLVAAVSTGQKLNWKLNSWTGRSFAVVGVERMRSVGAAVTIVLPGVDERSWSTRRRTAARPRGGSRARPVDHRVAKEQEHVEKARRRSSFTPPSDHGSHSRRGNPGIAAPAIALFQQVDDGVSRPDQ